MRCLYCGKELALLKRLRGGMEFCSDAHRQQYQDEFNELALSRLLQAKPDPNKNVAVLEPVPEPEPRVSDAGHRSMLDLPEADVPVEPVPQPEHAREPSAREEQRVSPTEPSGGSEPSVAPFLVEAPAVATATFHLRKTEWPGSAEIKVELPGAQDAPPPPDRTLRYGPVPVLLREARAGHAPPRGAILEPRPLIRTTQPDLSVRPKVRTTLPSVSRPLEAVFLPSPPPVRAALWSASGDDFPAAEAEFGDLGRMDSPALEAVVAWEEEPAHSSEPPVIEPEEEVAEVPVGSDAKLEVPALPSLPEDQESLPIPEPAPALVAVQDVSSPEPEPAQKPACVAPKLIVEPLRLEFQAIAAAGHGRPVQFLAAAVAGGGEPPIPATGAVPLRPVMVLRPKPAAPVPAPRPLIEAKPQEAKSAEAKRAEPKPAETRPVDAKPAETKPAGTPAIEKSTPELRPRLAEASRPRQDDPPPEPEKPVRRASRPPKEPEGAPERPSDSRPLPKIQADVTLPTLQLETSQSFWGRLSVVAKLGLAAGVLAAGAGIAYLVTSGGKPQSGPVAGGAPQVVPGAPVADSGWITDWAPDPNPRRAWRVSVLRGSLPLSDYRLEFQAQIETKALGWVYRAMNPKNFYVNKIEIVKPGLEPTIALVRFAVVNGEEQPRAQLPLPLKVRIDTLYKIRFEALGRTFKTWVQDQKIDEWTDDTFGSGGTGLYNERGEKLSMKGNVNLVPLVVKP